MWEEKQLSCAVKIALGGPSASLICLLRVVRGRADVTQCDDGWGTARRRKLALLSCYPVTYTYAAAAPSMTNECPHA